MKFNELKEDNKSDQTHKINWERMTNSDFFGRSVPNWLKHAERAMHLTGGEYQHPLIVFPNYKSMKRFQKLLNTLIVNTTGRIIDDEDWARYEVND